MKKIEIPSFEKFKKEWWSFKQALAKTELGTNGQFDEFPYEDYDNLLNIIKTQKIYFKFFNVGDNLELTLVDNKGNRVSNRVTLSINSNSLSNIVRKIQWL